MFVQAGEFLKKIHDRRAKNYNGLVRLQHHFNDCLNIIADNIFIGNDFLNIFSDEKIDAGNPIIFPSRFSQFPIERELIIDLTNLEYVNELYSLTVEIKKLNDSLQTVDLSYGEIKRAFLDKKIDLENYFHFIKYHRNKIIEILQFLSETQKDIKQLFAKARLLHQDAPFTIKLLSQFTRSAYTKNFENKLKDEIRKLESEISEEAQRSGEKINRIQG